MVNKTGMYRFLQYVAIALFIIGLFFLSPSITGNVIGPLDRNTSTIAGIIFVALGILGYYFIAKLADYL